MTSTVTMKCWLCPETFEKPLDLKSHAIERHDACRVICPWCPERRESFKRIVELKRHCNRKHLNLVGDFQELDFFNERNGFWLAVRPQDYAKIVKPSDGKDMMAARTRAALSSWLERRGSNEKPLGYWEAEWRRAQGVVPVHHTPNNRKRKYASSPEGRKEEAKHMGLVINSICLTSTEKVAYLKLEEKTKTLWFRVEFQPWIVDEKKAMESLLRRMMAAKGDEKPPTEFPRKVEKEAHYTIGQITNALGVLDRVLRDVRRGETGSINEKEIEEEVSRRMKELDDAERSMGNRIEEGGETEQEEMLERSNAEEERDSEENLEEEMERKEDTTIEEEEGGIEEDNLGEMDANTTEEEGNKQEDDNKEEEPEGEGSLTEKERAAKLLKRGGMPLFPPGRREWTGNSKVTLSTIPTIMSWPPAGWQNFTAEERLTAWRYAAFTLYREQGHDNLVREKDVLDRYTMLALPGTKIPIRKTTRQDPISLARTSNYQILIQIYSGQISGREANHWLQTFEATPYDETLKELLDRMEHIPLRTSTEQPEDKK